MLAPRITISARFAAVTLLNTVLLGMALSVATVLITNADAERNAFEAIDRNMRVAWHVVEENGPRFSLKDGALFAGEVALNHNFAPVDKIAELVGGTATIFMGETRIATNVKKEDGSRAIGTTLAKNAAHEAVFTHKTPYRGIIDILGKPYITGYDPIFDANRNVIGVLYVGVPTAQFFASAQSVEYWTILTTAIVGVIGLGLSLFLANRSIVRPLQAITTAMRRLTSGELGHDIPYTQRNDDIGGMAKALQVFQTNAAENERLRSEQASAEERSRIARKTEMNRLADRMEDRIRGVVREISASANSLHAASNTLSANAEQAGRQSALVAAATTQATINVETVSSAGVELTASIHEIASQAEQSTAIARSAVNEAEEANHKIEGLSETAQKIGEIVSLINTIAGQTNLLALNATIESARAGESGKGFAVVAHEVKNLASQTSRATEEIARQIAAVQDGTREAVLAIKNLGSTIASIDQLSTVIAGAVEEQGAATQEIGRNVDEASLGVRSAAVSIGDVAIAASETGRMAQSVYTEANGLLSQTATLEREVVSFLAEVRSA